MPSISQRLTALEKRVELESELQGILDEALFALVDYKAKTEPDTQVNFGSINKLIATVIRTPTVYGEGVHTFENAEGDEAVLIPSQAFDGVSDEKDVRALVKYSTSTGHRVRFLYTNGNGNTSEREVACYGFGGKVFEGFDTEAVNVSGGRGAYRTFRFDRVATMELV